MDFELTRRLLLYIVGQLQDQEGMISKIRIVKLLYLVDVEHYRMFGHTLTKLDWIFYEYGPYAFEIDTIIERLRFDLGEEEITTFEAISAMDEEDKFESRIEGRTTISSEAAQAISQQVE